MGGSFNSGRDGDHNTAAVGVRVDRPVAPWLLAEVGVLASRVRRVRSEDGEAFDRPQTYRTVGVPLAAADVQLQLQWPRGRVRPYIGAGGGLFGALRASGASPQFVRPSYTGAAGTRLDLTRSLGVRGELRFRSDAYPHSANTFDFEQTLGLSWRY